MDEEQLAPLPCHELEMVPPEMAQLFRDIIKYRVDPAGDYYGITVDQIVKQVQALDTGTVHGIDSEFRYEEKGKMFDPVIQSFYHGRWWSNYHLEQKRTHNDPGCVAWYYQTQTDGFM